MNPFCHFLTLALLPSDFFFCFQKQFNIDCRPEIRPPTTNIQKAVNFVPYGGRDNLVHLGSSGSHVMGSHVRFPCQNTLKSGFHVRFPCQNPKQINLRICMEKYVKSIEKLPKSKSAHQTTHFEPVGTTFVSAPNMPIILQLGD